MEPFPWTCPRIGKGSRNSVFRQSLLSSFCVVPTLTVLASLLQRTCSCCCRTCHTSSTLSRPSPTTWIGRTPTSLLVQGSSGEWPRAAVWPLSFPYFLHVLPWPTWATACHGWDQSGEAVSGVSFITLSEEPRELRTSSQMGRKALEDGKEIVSSATVANVGRLSSTHSRRAHGRLH